MQTTPYLVALLAARSVSKSRCGVAHCSHNRTSAEVALLSGHCDTARSQYGKGQDLSLLHASVLEASRRNNIVAKRFLPDGAFWRTGHVHQRIGKAVDIDTK